MYIADNGNRVVRKIDASTLKISTVAGGGSTSILTGPGTSLGFTTLSGISIDLDGNLYIAASNYYVYKLDINNFVTVIGGTGVYANTGDDGLALDAQLIAGPIFVRGSAAPFWNQNATLGAARSDVAAANSRSDYTNSGWSAGGYAVPLIPGNYNVRVFAYDSSNVRTRLTADKTIAITSQTGSFASLSLTALDFGTVNPKSTIVNRTAQLANLGNVALAISSISAPSGWSQTNTCGSSLTVAATCTITISFVPTQFGNNSGYLQISSNGVNGQVSVSLAGKLDLTVTVTRPTRPKRNEPAPAPVISSARPASDASPFASKPVPQYYFVAVPLPVEPTAPAKSKRGKKRAAKREKKAAPPNGN